MKPPSRSRKVAQAVVSAGVSRREALLGASALFGLAVAGCSSGSATENGSSTSGAGASASSAATTRTITHAKGTTQVPSAPQRVVTLLAQNGVDYMASVGLVPIGAALKDPGKQLAKMIPACHFAVPVDPSKIAAIGDPGETSLEAIAKLEPDLIFGWDYQVETLNYGKLSDIAPTVPVSPYNGPEWRKAGARIAEVLNRSAEWGAVEQSVKDKGKHLGDTLPAGQVVAYIRANEPGEYGVYETKSQPGDVLRLMGQTVFDLPKDTKLDEGDLSREQLGLLKDADFIMVGQLDDAPQGAQTLMRDPLWVNLPAVKAGRVFIADQTLWSNGGPAYYRDVAMDELAAAIKKKA